MPDETRLYSIRDAAALLGCTAETVRKTFAADIVRIGNLHRIPGLALAAAMNSTKAA